MSIDSIINSCTFKERQIRTRILEGTPSLVLPTRDHSNLSTNGLPVMDFETLGGSKQTGPFSSSEHACMVWHNKLLKRTGVPAAKKAPCKLFFLQCSPTTTLQRKTQNPWNEEGDLKEGQANHNLNLIVHDKTKPFFSEPLQIVPFHIS